MSKDVGKKTETVKVLVRARPMNTKETDRGKCIDANFVGCKEVVKTDREYC
jgi:hypothetical protein